MRVEFANQLRAVAALSVLIYHYFGIFWLNPQAVGSLILCDPLQITHVPWLVKKLNHLPHFSFGAFGVSLFFLISGFVIPYSLKNSSNLLFCIRRFLRIYPLYALAFLITAALLYLCRSLPFPYTIKQLCTHTFPLLRDFSPVPAIDGIEWTLEIEIKFYILCVLFRKWLFCRRILFIPCLLFLIQVLLRKFAGSYFNLNQILFQLQFIIYMLIGTSYYLVREKKISLEVWSLSLIFIFTLLANTVPLLPGTEVWTPYLWSQGFALLFFFLAATFPQLLRSRFFSFYADISFPLYLIHGAPGYILMAYLYRHGVPPLVTAGLATMAATAAAYSLHLLFEKPLLDFSRAIQQRPAQLYTNEFKSWEYDKEAP